MATITTIDVQMEVEHTSIEVLAVWLLGVNKRRIPLPVMIPGFLAPDAMQDAYADAKTDESHYNQEREK